MGPSTNEQKPVDELQKSEARPPTEVRVAFIDNHRRVPRVEPIRGV